MRGRVIDEYPDEVRKKIEHLIGSNFNGRAIHQWLEREWFVKWRESGQDNLIITERTVRNWVRNYAPQKRLLSQSYIDSAVKRMGEDINAIEELGRVIHEMRELANSFPDEGELSLRQKGEKRRILKEIANISDMYEKLRMRLGLTEESPKKTVSEHFITKLTEIRHKHEGKGEDKSKEEKLYEKVVEKE